VTRPPPPPQAAEPPDVGPEEEAATVESFGRWLRLERELRGLSREQVVRVTRLAPAVVEGLESGDPARMPPRGYVYGYLRTYAGALGLDADDVVLRWQEVEAAEAPPEEPPRRAAAPSARVYAIAVAAAAAIAAIAAWLLR
jgi:cytoskeletal protein RodZ